LACCFTFFFVWTRIYRILGIFRMAGWCVVVVFPVRAFCLKQDLRDIRNIRDGRLMWNGRFSGSGFFVWFFCLAFLCDFYLAYCLNHDLRDWEGFSGSGVGCMRVFWFPDWRNYSLGC
jgi:hypothetical protein